MKIFGFKNTFLTEKAYFWSCLFRREPSRGITASGKWSTCRLLSRKLGWRT